MLPGADDDNSYDDYKHNEKSYDWNYDDYERNGNDDDDDNDNNDNDVSRPGETVELPCDASDADKFVRVWMKVGFS